MGLVRSRGLSGGNSFVRLIKRMIRIHCRAILGFNSPCFRQLSTECFQVGIRACTQRDIFLNQYVFSSETIAASAWLYRKSSDRGPGFPSCGGGRERRCVCM